jgi:hypothetical protein
MEIRTVLIAGALSAALPALASAATQGSLSAACGRAFAAHLGLGTGDTPAYKLVPFSGYSESSVERFYAEDFVLDMIAHSAKTGAVIAKASCVVSRNGKVISLDAEPLTAGDPRVALRQ